MHPGVMPLVELTTTKFRSRHFGEIDKPEFVVRGWVGPDGELFDIKIKKAKPTITTPATDLDDDIPF